MSEKDFIPPYGELLTAKTVKLVKPGDLVKRHTGEHCGVSAGTFCLVNSVVALGLRLNVGDPDATHAEKKISFIARADPANAGWYLPPKGGFPENPVPGKWVEYALRGGHTDTQKSEGCRWTHFEPPHWISDIIRFRIVDEPVKTDDEYVPRAGIDDIATHRAYDARQAAKQKAPEQPVQPKETVAEVVGRLKRGDRVRVTFGGVVDDDGDVNIGEDAGYIEDWLLRDAASIEILPLAAKPLTVGEVVLRGGKEYEVAAVRSWDVCLYTEDGLTASTINDLSRKCGTPIAESE